MSYNRDSSRDRIFVHPAFCNQLFFFCKPQVASPSAWKPCKQTAIGAFDVSFCSICQSCLYLYLSLPSQLFSVEGVWKETFHFKKHVHEQVRKNWHVIAWDLTVGQTQGKEINTRNFPFQKSFCENARNQQIEYSLNASPNSWKNTMFQLSSKLFQPASITYRRYNVTAHALTHTQTHTHTHTYMTMHIYSSVTCVEASPKLFLYCSYTIHHQTGKHNVSTQFENSNLQV